MRAALLSLIVALSSTAAASPATHDECGKAMARIKAWEGDSSPATEAEMADCVKQASGEQARCIIAAATKEAGKACVGMGPPPPPPRVEDPLDKKPAPCRLTAGAVTPLPPALAHLARLHNADDVRPHQSLILAAEGGARVLDPTDLRRLVPVGDELREALLLPSRLVAVRAGELVTAPPSGAPLTSLRQSDRIRSIDAVAAGREIFVAGTDERALFVDRIDASGKLAAHHVVHNEQPFVLRLVRSSGGALALAWLAIEGDATALRFAWLDRDGNLKGKPVRVDTAPDRQIFANVTLAPHRDGVVVAWNPIVGKGDRETVLVELRAFGADVGGAPSPLRRVPTTSQSWVVAGSAGGVLPNGLQALPFGRETALVWIAYEREKGGIDAVLVDGGAPLRLATVGGAPIARSDGKTATLLLEDQNGGNKSLTLRCEK